MVTPEVIEFSKNKLRSKLSKPPPPSVSGMNTQALPTIGSESAALVAISFITIMESFFSSEAFDAPDEFVALGSEDPPVPLLSSRELPPLDCSHSFI